MKKTILLCALFLFFTGCTALENSRRQDTSINNSEEIFKTEKESQKTEEKSDQITAEISKKIIKFGESEREKITTYTIKKDTLNFEIRENTESPKTIRGWHVQDEKDALIIINGFYFDENYNATGKLTVNGEEKGTAGYDADKSALVKLGRSVLVKRKSKLLTDQHTLFAGDTFPVLIEDGTSQISENSTKTARRSFIGNDIDGNTVLGVSDAPLSLYDFAKHLQESEINLTTAANLDGGPSSGISIKAGNTNEYINSYSSIPNVIVAFPR